MPHAVRGTADKPIVSLPRNNIEWADHVLDGSNRVLR
jgi:Flp pilus assembly CpaE family ATPase